jgi:hypothetical protein
MRHQWPAGLAGCGDGDCRRRQARHAVDQEGEQSSAARLSFGGSSSVDLGTAPARHQGQLRFRPLAGSIGRLRPRRGLAEASRKLTRRRRRRKRAGSAPWASVLPAGFTVAVTMRRLRHSGPGFTHRGTGLGAVEPPNGGRAKPKKAAGRPRPRHRVDA